MTETLPLQGKRALIFIDDLYEDLELLYPRLRLIEAGCEVQLAGLAEPGAIHRGKHGYPIASDIRATDKETTNVDDYDALICPGGFAPDKLRRSRDVLRITRDFHEAGKPLAHICHGGWIPISAGVVRGLTVTSTPGIRDDLVNAGAEWVDRECVVDRNHITARRPDDLPAFCRALLEMMGAA